MDNPIFSILTSEKSRFNVTLDSDQNNAVQSAMSIYAARMVDKFRSEQNKRAVTEALVLFPSLWKGEIMLWLRRRSFLKACRNAQLEADSAGYKIYVIRSSNIGFTLMSTLDVSMNKKIRVFKKDVNAIELEKTASFTATRKVHPLTLKRK